MKRKKQLLSWILSFLMVFSIMPMISISAFATEYDNNKIVVSNTLKPGDIIKNSNPKDPITIYYEDLPTIGVPVGVQHTVCDFPSSDEYMFFNWKVNKIYTSSEKVVQIELTLNWKEKEELTYDLTNTNVGEEDVEVTDGNKQVIDGKTYVTTGASVSIPITANTGYKLPDTIAVEMGGSTLGDSEYKYDQATGKIEIGNIIGDVKITAAGVKLPDATIDVSNVTKTSAALSGTVTLENKEIVGQGFEWKKTDGGTYVQIPEILNNGILSASLTGLTEGTSYTVRSYVVTGTNTYYSTERTFTTEKNTSSEGSSNNNGGSGGNTSSGGSSNNNGGSGGNTSSGGGSNNNDDSGSKSEILVGELTNEAIINNLKTSEYKKIQVNIDSNPNLLLSKSVIDDLIANKDKTLVIVSNNVSTNITTNEKNEMQFTRNGNVLTGFVSVCNAEYYLNYNGIVQKGWIQFPGETWYYFDKETGIKAKGWINDNGTWYYSNSVGVMQTGWINDSGTWYYLNSNGSMAHDTRINGYLLGSSGAYIKE